MNRRATVAALVIVIALIFAMCTFGQKAMDDAATASAIGVMIGS